MKFLLPLLFCGTLLAQPRIAFLGTCNRASSPYWATTSGVGGSPCSNWVAVAGGVAVTQDTSANRPTITASAFGSNNGLTFNGTSQYLSTTNKVIYRTGSATLSVVFKTPATVTGPVVLVSQADSAAANDWWELGIAADGKLYVESDAAGTKMTVEGSTVLAASTIYNAILAYDGVDYYILLNGVEENPLVITNIGAFAWAGRVTGTTVFAVGATCASGGAARFFNGSIAGVYWWNGDITR